MRIPTMCALHNKQSKVKSVTKLIPNQTNCVVLISGCCWLQMKWTCAWKQTNEVDECELGKYFHWCLWPSQQDITAQVQENSWSVLTGWTFISL